MAAAGRDRATQRDVAFACQVGDVGKGPVEGRGAREVEIKALASTLNTAGQAQACAGQARIASKGCRAVIGLAAERRDRAVERHVPFTRQIRQVRERTIKGCCA